MATGGVITGELLLNTSSFIANFDKAMQHVQNKANSLKNFANPIVDGMRNAEKSVNNSAQNIEKKLNNTAKNVGISYDNLWNKVWNRDGNAAVTGFFNRVDGLNQKMASNVESVGSRIGNAWNGVMQRMSNSSNAGVRAIGNNLSIINGSRFDRLATNFEATVKRMTNIAQSGAKSIRNYLEGGLGASDYMATIMGGMIGGQVWESAQGKATTQAMMQNRYTPDVAAQYYGGYQKYTIASSTSDQQISNLLKYVLGSNIAPNQTYRALSAMDAAAFTPDPVQRQERLRNYGQYLTTGYQAALFRGDVTPEQAKILQAAQTPEQRIAAMEQVSKMQGSMDQFGNNISTMTSGPLGNFNKVLIITDTLMRAMTQGFTDLLNAASPLLDWFIKLDPATQNTIGKFIFFTGGALVLASTLGILISVLSPVFSLIGFVTVATVSMVTGLDMAIVSELGFAGSLDYTALSLGAYILGLDMATASQLGLSGMLDYAAISFVAFITGESAATVATWSFTEALWASASAILMNPITWIAIAIIGVTIAIYELGRAWGWWNDLSGFSAAIMAQLGNVWNYLVSAGQQLYVALSGLGNYIYGGLLTAWNTLVWAGQSLWNILNMISGAVNWVFGIPGSGNWLIDSWNRLVLVGQTLWNVIMAIATAFSIVTDAFNSGQGILGGLWNALNAIPQAIGFIIFSIADWFLSIDWVGIFARMVDGFSSAIDGIIAWLENFDFATLFGGQQAGETAGNQLVTGVENTVKPDKFSQLIQKVSTALSKIDWGAVLTKVGELMVKLGIAILVKLPYIAWLLISGLATAIWSGLSSIDWGKLAVDVINFLVWAFANYNPVTLMINALFGKDAAATFSNGIMAALQGIGNIAGQIWGFLFGGGAQNAGQGFLDWITSSLGNIGQSIITWISSVDWGAIATSVLSTIFTLIGHYNPITLLMQLLFGDEAAQGMQNSIVSLLWTLVQDFINGLTVLWGVIVTVGTAILDFWNWLWPTVWSVVSWVWDNIIMKIWNTLVSIWNFAYPLLVQLWNTITWIWTSIWNTTMWVWNTIGITIWNALISIWNFAYPIMMQLWNTITWIWNSIWNTSNWVWNNIFLKIWGVLKQIWDTAKPIIDKLSEAWNKLKDGMVTAAGIIKDKVYGPIKWLWDKLSSFWNWLTHPFGGGSGGGNAGNRYAGAPDISQLNKTSSAGNGKYAGFFAGVLGAAFNNIESITGINPATVAGGGYAGGYYSGDATSQEQVAKIPMDNSCLTNDCYAGDYDFSKYWIDDILKIAKGWKMNINGDLIDVGLLGNGNNLKLFTRLITDLIAPTHYQFYYDHKYDPAEALKRGYFNCWDGAQIVMGLARAMGLKTGLAKGYWGNTNTRHVWAMVEGIPFDTTAFQQRRSWFPPPGSMRNYTNPNPFAAGGYAGGYYGTSQYGFAKELHLYLHIGDDVEKIVLDLLKEEKEDRVIGIKRNIRY